MKYKANLYFNGQKICDGIFEADLLYFPREEGTIYTDSGFKITYKALKTKENKKELNDFLKKYPTPESLPNQI